MRVEIDRRGLIVITAETNEEAYALKYILEDNPRAPESKVIYDMRILDDDET